MSPVVFQVPEILDSILEYVSRGIDGQQTLYTCLFVNHQFQAHATRFLYRHLSFHAQPNKRKLEAENRLCHQLYQRPALALHVRSLFLNLTKNSRETPRFAERIKPVLRALRNLGDINLHTSTWEGSLRRLSAVLRILINLESHPEVSFTLGDNDKIRDCDIEDFGYPILRINSRLSIKSFTIREFWSSTKLRFLSQFPI